MPRFLSPPRLHPFPNHLYSPAHPHLLPLCNSKLGNLAHLLLHLTPNLVRHAPPQLDRLDLAVPAPRVPDVDGLGHALALLGLQRPPRLRFQLQLVALPRIVSTVCLCRWRGRGVGVVLTFVTASWKCSSDTWRAVLFEKPNDRTIKGAALVVRFASMSILSVVLLTSALCSCGTSGGSADEKFHSSSSFATAAGGTGVAGLGDSDASAANGSVAAG